jgi:hypothetical protein
VPARDDALQRRLPELRLLSPELSERLLRRSTDTWSSSNSGVSDFVVDASARGRKQGSGLVGQASSPSHSRRSSQDLFRSRTVERDLNAHRYCGAGAFLCDDGPRTGRPIRPDGESQEAVQACARDGTRIALVRRFEKG